MVKHSQTIWMPTNQTQTNSLKTNGSLIQSPRSPICWAWIISASIGSSNGGNWRRVGRCAGSFSLHEQNSPGCWIQNEEQLQKGRAHSLIIFLSRCNDWKKVHYSSEYNLTVTMLLWYSSSRSMKTCLNISTTSWPTMSVAKATRHSRLSQGCVFSLGLSIAYSGQNPETNLDRLTVSR